MQESNILIDKRQIKHMSQMKAAPPKLKAQLKLYKTGIPIRPVINNRTAPVYKLEKHLTKIIDLLHCIITILLPAPSNLQMA